jgi:formylglycine-generating enzyme required for sulfatase activity
MYREQTTDMGSFPANAWGLHDMHGNVWEWCADHWYASYDFAPGDEQSQLIPATAPDELLLLRVGSWYYFPRYCRSVSRSHFPPGLVIDGHGFRVVCLPQDQLLVT